jgi:hypothetical protein
MATLNLEVTPSAAQTLAELDEEKRRDIELTLTAQLARLLAPIMERAEAAREIERIAERAEQRAIADGLTLEALNRLIDESK